MNVNDDENAVDSSDHDSIEKEKEKNESDNDVNIDDDDSVPAVVVLYLVYVIPFFLKLASTIPPMYLSVALEDIFGASGLQQGVIIAMFQFARALVIGITMFSPFWSIALGSVFGTLGFVCLLFYPMWQDSSYALTLFATANVMIGLTNGLSALQVFAKQEYSKDMNGLRFALRRQSVISGFACIISYFLSGFIYARLGLTVIGYLGCGVMGVALVAVAMYLLGRQRRLGKSNDENDKIVEKEVEDTKNNAEREAKSSDEIKNVTDEEDEEKANKKLPMKSGIKTSRCSLAHLKSFKDVVKEREKCVAFRTSVANSSASGDGRARTSMFSGARTSMFGGGGARTSMFGPPPSANTHVHFAEEITVLASTLGIITDDEEDIDCFGEETLLTVGKEEGSSSLSNKESTGDNSRRIDSCGNVMVGEKEGKYHTIGEEEESSSINISTPEHHTKRGSSVIHFSTPVHHTSSGGRPVTTVDENESSLSLRSRLTHFGNYVAKMGIGRARSSDCSLRFQLDMAIQSGECQKEHQEKVMGRFSETEDVALNGIVFVVASAFLIEAVTSGSLFSIGPLYIELIFSKDTSYTATIYGLSSVFGTCFTFFILTEKGRELCSKYLPSPANMYTLMLIISISTICLVVPNFIVHVICVIFIIGFNEALWALLTEMEGAITSEKYYLTIGPGALMIHKVINMAVSFVCPILLHVQLWLPYICTGGIALVFSLFFVFKVERQRRINARLLAKINVEKRMTVAEKEAMRMSFATLETLSRMASCRNRRDMEKKKRNIFTRMNAFTGYEATRKLMRNSVAIN